MPTEMNPHKMPYQTPERVFKPTMLAFSLAHAFGMQPPPLLVGYRFGNYTVLKEIPL